MQTSEDLPICVTCGTQFDQPTDKPPSACHICDDPRQYVPPTGQAWTTLRSLRDTHHTNNRQHDPHDPRLCSIWTEPKCGIGQRCILLETPHGNVLWDCITYLDDETVRFITAKGGLRAIVISHPHYYSTHLDWAETFDCPVYIAQEDEGWTSRADARGRRRLIAGTTEQIVEGVLTIKVGGHFPGSLVLLWDGKLLIADSLMTVPSAYYHVDRPAGTTSYAFMWSIPNMIPLPPSELYNMWQALKPFEFESTYGAFVNTDVRDKKVKARVLESMKIQARNMGWEDVAILKQTL